MSTAVGNGSDNFIKANVDRILVPVDFSHKTPLALQRAVEVAHLYGASIWLLHVLDVMVFIGNGVPGALEEMRDRSELALEELASSVKKQQVECHALLCEGDLDGQIQKAITAHGIDLLVLATKAGTAMHGFALASTAERILRKTMIPVLTVADCHPLRKWGADGCVHVFCATDLSPESIHGINHARAVQRRFCARFTIAHVLPKHASPEKTVAAREKLKALADDSNSEVLILHGDVGQKICEGAAKAEADLIAIGVKKHSLLREVLVGHTLLEILAGACCPVLTIRQ